MKRFRPRTRRQKLVRDLFLLVLLLLLAYILLDFPMFTPKQAAEVTQTRYLFGPAELLELVRPEPDGNQFYYVGQTDEYHCVITLTRRGLFWYSGQVNAVRVDPDAPLHVLGTSSIDRIFMHHGFVLFSNDPSITQIEVEYIYDYDDARPLLRRVSYPMTGSYRVVLPDEQLSSVNLLYLDNSRFYGYDASGALVYASPEPDAWKEVTP